MQPDDNVCTRARTHARTRRTPFRPGRPRVVRSGAAAALLAVLTVLGLLTSPAPQAAAAGAGATARPAVTTWAASADHLGAASGTSDLTFRLKVHISTGGTGLRLRLSNAFGDSPAVFGHVYVGRSTAGADVEPGTNRPVTFHGAPGTTVTAHGSTYSDPLPGRIPDESDLAVSIYVQTAPSVATGHHLAMQKSYFSTAGDHAADESDAAYPNWTGSWFYLDAITVTAPRPAGTVVAFGDSITDGWHSSYDVNRRWPDFLGRRLLADPDTRLKGVANEGISGNRVLGSAPDGQNQSALARMDRDVLSQRGLRTVVLLDGVNDIKWTPAPTAAQLIDGYRQIIARAHARGVCVVGATVMPYRGWSEWTEAGEQVRQQVNRFIRSSGAFDAVADFDRTVADPADPTRIDPALDGGDHLHPNDTGMSRMADAVDLPSLTCHR